MIAISLFSMEIYITMTISPKPSEPLEITHFGDREVPIADKKQLVAEVFASVAPSYDVMNDLMSFGLHRYWKKVAIDLSYVSKGQRVLDLAGGTGDLAAKFSKLVGETGKVTLSDINPAMLEAGRRKLIDKGLVGNIDYVIADAEDLPFESNYFDCVTMSFGLRNVTDKDRALASIFRVLKPGGRLLVLEFSKPTSESLRTLYDLYSEYCIPTLGQWVAKDEASYRYLVESIRKHPDQETLLKMMQVAGFEDAEYRNLTGGIVALHRGYKY
jgi:demethylmenaquinone methyltransferase/2-methoxy-6-polyprenyl-1,4-benzoquinol methylase